MKAKTTKTILATTLLLFAAFGSTIAQPPGKGTMQKKLAANDDRSALGAGDQAEYVCHQCHAASGAEMTDPAQKVCKIGDVVQCPACKVDYKLTRKGHPAGKGSGAGLKREAVFVNYKGEPCKFY